MLKKKFEELEILIGETFQIADAFGEIEELNNISKKIDRKCKEIKNLL